MSARLGLAVVTTLLLLGAIGAAAQAPPDCPAPDVTRYRIMRAGAAVGAAWVCGWGDDRQTYDFRRRVQQTAAACLNTTEAVVATQVRYWEEGTIRVLNEGLQTCEEFVALYRHALVDQMLADGRAGLAAERARRR